MHGDGTVMLDVEQSSKSALHFRAQRGWFNGSKKRPGNVKAVCVVAAPSVCARVLWTTATPEKTWGISLIERAS